MLGKWLESLDGAHAVVNLAGRTVNCIKTPDHQDEILRSRVESTRVLGEAMRAVNSPPSVWVQMSTPHIYGDPPRIFCKEEGAEVGMASLMFAETNIVTSLPAQLAEATVRPHALSSGAQRRWAIEGVRTRTRRAFGEAICYSGGHEANLAIPAPGSDSRQARGPT